GIPSLCMADGPHGLRKQTGNQDNGISQSELAIAFPTAVTVASSWNPDNAYLMGEAIAKECTHYGVDILLGPGANIKRNPLCGRNFEYYSEDPLLSSKMGAEEVHGLQNNGVGATVKHFALNNSENYRFMGNSIADERAMREIYLKSFEHIVKEGKPYAMMCAYNQINGTFCSENKWLLNDVLRDEWGFDGLVMTDWGAMKDRIEALKAGLDLEMPGDTAICRKWIRDSINDKTLSIEVLDKAVINVLKLINKCENTTDDSIDFELHDRLACAIAEDSAVLMKNDGILPLNKGEKYLITGMLFEKMRYQGSGSSMINAIKVTSPKDAFDKAGISYEYCTGYEEKDNPPDISLITKAVEKSRLYDKVLVFAGLTDYVESEGSDRETMKLPQNQIALIDQLIAAGKKVVIILFGGSVCELPFKDNVSAILNMFLPGQNGGTATQRLLFGLKNPCGKLSETWPDSYDDVPYGNDFGKSINEVYKESIFVGYRYYLTANKKVAYPFGYGLSYTAFEYSDMRVEKKDSKFTVSCNMKNVGKYDGAEVVQLYVKAPKSDVIKPLKELRAFTKVYLSVGESKRVEMVIDEDNLHYYNTSAGKWLLETGQYDIFICSDCTEVKLSQTVSIEGDDSVLTYSQKVVTAYNKDIADISDDIFEEVLKDKIPLLQPRRPFTIESRFSDLSDSLTGKMLFKSVMSVANKQRRQAEKLPEGLEKDNRIKGALFLSRILESNSLRSMSMSASKSFPYNFALGFMEMANGHIIKGIKHFLTKIEAPELPKEREDA
ncbi:MAG: glycoside hydrolase family 3 C-terminal domain-containing protein, partial [Clostridia bacterium]|nr:glycoside hydrolase family 3 C-terminal domain-containing protein [Clostridia bacterium]